MSEQQIPWVSLRSRNLSVEINPLGAQLSILRDEAGRDLLWDGDPSVWNGRSPLLFPIVGTLAGGKYRIGSATYELPRHGFARGRLFDILDSTPTAATFRLTADDASLGVYPFRFELQVQYALEARTLSVTALIRNTGDEEMPASFGYHPAFRWPLPFGQARSSHFIEFATDESASVRRLNAAGLVTAERHPSPVDGRRLTLTDALFQDDVIIFDDIRSRSVTYGAAAGPCIRVGFPDAPYLGLWSKPRANFICIEPWHGMADFDGFSGDFGTKTGVFILAPGATVPAVMTITLLAESMR